MYKFSFDIEEASVLVVDGAPTAPTVEVLPSNSKEKPAA